MSAIFLWYVKISMAIFKKLQTVVTVYMVNMVTVWEIVKETLYLSLLLKRYHEKKTIDRQISGLWVQDSEIWNVKASAIAAVIWFDQNHDYTQFHQFIKHVGVSGNIPSIQKIALLGTVCILRRAWVFQILSRFQMSSLTYRAVVKKKNNDKKNRENISNKV